MLKRIMILARSSRFTQKDKLVGKCPPGKLLLILLQCLFLPIPLPAIFYNYSVFCCATCTPSSLAHWCSAKPLESPVNGKNLLQWGVVFLMNE